MLVLSVTEPSHNEAKGYIHSWNFIAQQEKAWCTNWKLLCTRTWTNSFQVCIPGVSLLETVRKWTQFPNSFQIVYTGHVQIAYPLHTNLILWKLCVHLVYTMVIYSLLYMWLDFGKWFQITHFYLVRFNTTTWREMSIPR